MPKTVLLQGIHVSLVHAVRIYSQDIEMEFVIEKYAMIVMKSGKGHITDGMELPKSRKFYMIHR